MKTVWEQILARYGQDLTMEPGGQTVQAFFQPLAEKSEQVPDEMTGIGWLGRAAVAVSGDDVPGDRGYPALAGTAFSGQKLPPLLSGGADDGFLGSFRGGEGGGIMKELMQISQAVIDALSEAGVQAMAAFPPERVKQYDGAVAAVSVGTAEGKAVGFCNYLGQVWDEEAGTVEELYGKQLEAVITVEIRAARASLCEEAALRRRRCCWEVFPSGSAPGN